MFYSLVFMFFMSLLSLLLIRKHIFLCLLSLEFIVVSLLMMSFLFLMLYSLSFYVLIILMVFFVCEGVLGLSILVTMIRLYGNDYISSLSLW